MSRLETIMKVTLGTFNLNNLFSRYNFKGEIKAIKDEDTAVNAEYVYQFGPTDRFKIRKYRGKLVKKKDGIETRKVADRIKEMDLDVLAVQEVEDIDTLREFNRDQVNGRYPFFALVEGNDPRLIDIGILSKLQIGAITSWQHAVHASAPTTPIFGRDLLEVQILNASRSQVLFTLFNNHLKSNFVDYRDDPVEGARKNNQRRQRQAEVMAEIVLKRTRPNSRFAILGDMNDAPDSSYLAPLTSSTSLDLTNALTDPKETRPTKKSKYPPPGPAWTHRYKPRGGDMHYQLYDQIWLSPSLAKRQTGAWIHRRKNLTGDGSDHDPAWIELSL
jgi:endonuclease/exonuclease/phosphatase family metal-dependent hydrolase